MWQEGYKTLVVRTTGGVKNPVRTGILRTDKATAVGLQVGFGISAMLDLNEVTQLIRNLQDQRSALINLTGGFDV